MAYVTDDLIWITIWIQQFSQVAAVFLSSFSILALTDIIPDAGPWRSFNLPECSGICYERIRIKLGLFLLFIGQGIIEIDTQNFHL